MQLPLSSTSEQEAGLAKPGTSSKWTETQRLGLGAKKPSSHPHVLRHCADGAGRVARCSPRKQKKQQRSSPQGGGSAKVMVALAVTTGNARRHFIVKRVRPRRAWRWHRGFAYSTVPRIWNEVVTHKHDGNITAAPLLVRWTIGGLEAGHGVLRPTEKDQDTADKLGRRQPFAVRKCAARCRSRRLSVSCLTSNPAPSTQ